MNEIKAIDGKLYLMPDFTEVALNSVLGIMAIIRTGEESLKHWNLELEAYERMCKKLKVMSDKGIDTAVRSLIYEERQRDNLKRVIFEGEKELDNYRFSLEIAREQEKRTIIAEELSKLNLNRQDILKNSSFEVSDSLKPIKPNSQALRDNLIEHGFFELEKVKELNDDGRRILIEKLNQNRLPYAIAMLDYLGFLKYLSREYFPVKKELNQAVSKWFNSDKDGRAVRGNMNALLLDPTEQGKRYTAHTKKEIVKKDHENLK